MLQTIKECILNKSPETFGEYYQEFVIVTQDRLLDKLMCQIASELPENLKSSNELIKGINMLAEELIKL